MRLGIAAAATALLAAAPADCGDGGGEQAGGGGKIAFLLPESKTTRYEQQDRPNFERRVRELCPKCQVIYANAGQDAAKQQQQAEAAITQGAKVLVLDAVDVKSAASIVQRAKRSNIPVISYGRLVANADLDYYVSIDPFQVGQQQGRALVAALRAKGETQPSVVMINGAPTDSNAGPYKRGARTVLVASQAKVYQPIKRIAETAAELAVPIARGQKPPDIARARVNNGMEDVPSVLLGTIVVTKDNVEETVIADGFLSPRQICVGDDAQACRDAGIG
jgi:ABC-type xylose transport system substrate-binding protein